MCPDFANVFVGGQAVESLEAFGAVVGHDEYVQVSVQLQVAVVMIALGGGVHDDSIHALDLPVGSRMMWLGQAMPWRRQMRSKGRSRSSAVGPLRFLGRSANWMPLSVSTVWIWQGTTVESLPIPRIRPWIVVSSVPPTDPYPSCVSFTWPLSWSGSHGAAPVPSDSLDFAVSPLSSWRLGVIPGTSLLLSLSGTVCTTTFRD